MEHAAFYSSRQAIALVQRGYELLQGKELKLLPRHPRKTSCLQTTAPGLLDLVASVEERAALKDNRDTCSAATQIQVAAKGPFVFELTPH